MRPRLALVLPGAILLALLPAAAASGATITAQPRLVPSFRTGVVDYVTRCKPGEPVRLRIVTGGEARTREEQLEPGQAASVTIRSGGRTRRYHVRCLPQDFPRWKFERFRKPQAQLFLFAPQQGATQPSSHYVTFIDGHGTPLWWMRRKIVPFNSLLLPGGEIAWARWYEEPFGITPTTGWEIHRLDGRLVRTLHATGSPTDLHDFEPLPNGHFLLFTYRLRRHVDLRPYDGPADGIVVDGVIQEQDASGRVVWHWNSKDHVSIAENAGAWRGSYRRLPNGTNVYDYFHLNSVQPDGDGLIISARHMDAVYRIDRATGRITWKLGGTKRPESLTVIGDHRDKTFSGQHDARLLPDGTLTVYDNHTPGAPRAMRFRIDAAKRRATLLEQVEEPSLVWSPAEGSARRLPGGDWVVSWGATPLLEELAATNDPTWRLTLERGQSYRITPIPRGTLAASTLRQAMDAMHPS